MRTPKTLQQAIQHFSDEKNCRDFMVSMRWADDKVRCPRCGSENVSWLEKAKLYFCPAKHEKQKFSLKVGTIFEDSPISLQKWLPAMWLLCNAKNGISSYELHRALGVTQKTAWFMLHRIRLAMKNKSMLKIGTGGGPVEIDETWVGGKAKNMHAKRRGRIKDGWEAGKRRRIQGARREAIEAIDALKPYKGGNDPLWLLRRLDNTDKHSFILPIGADVIVGGVSLKAYEPYFTSLNGPEDNQDVNLASDETLTEPAVGRARAFSI